MIEFRPKETEDYKYKKELKEAFPDQYPSKMGSMPVGKEYHNPSAEEETGKRKAFKGVAWIKYWQYLSGNNSNPLKCTFCGEDIFINVENVDALTFRMENKEKLTDASDVQAIGGHLHLNGIDDSDGYMIVPMCKLCNAKSSDEALTVKESNMFVEEIGATVMKDM